jgi:hypothetical protein
MTRIRNAISFSNVIAFVALFVALGGSVYAAGKAGKINGNRIKPSSIPGNRLKASAVATKQLKAKAVSAGKIKPKTIGGGKIKPESLGDTQIKGSTLTDVSAASIGAVYYASSTASVPSSPPPTGTSTAATCPPGTYAIGGGASLSDDSKSFVNDAGPTALRTGWEGTFYGAEGTSMTVTAICTAVKAIG